MSRLIDGVLLSVVLFVIVVPIHLVALSGGSFGSGAGFGGGFTGSGFVAGIAGAAVGVGYFAMMESSRGQTVGKMATKRNLWIALFTIPFIGGLAELGAAIYIAVTISQSPTRTGWHDNFAGGTRVMQTG